MLASREEEEVVVFDNIVCFHRVIFPPIIPTKVAAAATYKCNTMHRIFIYEITFFYIISMSLI